MIVIYDSYCPTACAIFKNSINAKSDGRSMNSGVSLVTNNEVDFKDCPGLVVENWALSA